LSASRCLPVDERWSRYAHTQRWLCERFAAPVIGTVTCQDIKTEHTQKIVNAAPTPGEGARVQGMISALVSGVRHRAHRVIQPLVSPYRSDGDHPVIGLAVPAQPLMTHVRGLRPVLAVPAVIDHQHPRIMRGGRGIRAQQLQPAGVDPLRIPPRLREEELQPLHRRILRPGHRLGPGQRRQRLVPVPRRQQPGQVLPEPRRCARRPNRSSNRAAYSSSGPGATGQRRRPVITHPTASHATTPRHTSNPPESTNYR
jgi:hypothetical protein